MINHTHNQIALRLTKNTVTFHTGSHFYEFIQPGAGLSAEGLEQHIERLLSKFNLSPEQIKNLLLDDKPGIIPTLYKFREKYDPKSWWEYVKTGKNSFPLISLFRRGKYRAPDHVIKKHADYLEKEFLKGNFEVGSWVDALEMSKYINDRSWQGVKAEGNTFYLITYKSGEETDKEPFDPIHKKVTYEHVPTFDPKKPETFKSYIPEISKDTQKWIGDPYKTPKTGPASPGLTVPEPWNK